MMRIASVLAVLVLLLAQAANDDNNYQLQNGTNCGPEGTAESAPVKELNRHKNRNSAPTQDAIDPLVSLVAMLAPGADDNRFDAEKGATITGLVIDVKKGGLAESCNCGATDLIDMDTHIELSLAAGAAPNQRVIVEVTPRLRKQMKEQGKNWSTAALHQSLKGKWVKFTGWLMFDFIHADKSENTSPGNPANFRATAWEIHPVTSFEILDGPPEGVAAFQPTSFAALQGAHALHVQQDARTKDLIKKRNDARLEQLTEKERKEKEDEQKEHER
jgi:hypothetical protein